MKSCENAVAFIKDYKPPTLPLLRLTTANPDFTNQYYSFLTVFYILHQYHEILFLFMLGLLRA